MGSLTQSHVYFVKTSCLYVLESQSPAKQPQYIIIVDTIIKYY